MKPRILMIIAAVALAALTTWFFALRGHGGRARPSVPTASDGPGPGGRPGGRPDGADRNRPGTEPAAVLVDDDPAGSQRLEGLVLSADEQPVAGAVVTLSANPPRIATTDTDGSFAFDHLVGRPYTIVARAAAGVAGPITAKASAAMLVLHLRPAGAVTVTVVDGKQRPVVSAVVELRGLDLQAATTGADGVARFTTVVPGPYDVMARAPGYAPSFGFKPVPAGEVALTVVLKPGAPVSGRVVDASGLAVAGARVVYAGASDWGVRPDDRLDGVMSAADGSWKFAAIGAGSYRFVARHPSHAPGSSALISLDGVSGKDGVLVTMPVGATVRGKVVDGNQQPVASAQVRIGDAGRNMVGEPPRQVFSADDGTFVVEGLPRKLMAAVAIAETAASATVAVDTTAGDVRDVVLRVDVTGVIAGIVVDRSGEPQDGVQVSAMPDFRGGNFDPGAFRLRGRIQDLTDGDGHFELVGLAPGSYVVSASRSASGRGGRPFGGDGETAETGTKNLRIVLPADGGVKGKVAFADGSAPVGFSVSAGAVQDQAGGKDGSFQLTDLPPRAYRLTVRGSDLDDKTVDVTVEEGKVADAGTITVTKGRRIAGRVTHAGQPVAGATVYAGAQIFGTGTSNEAQFGMPGRAPARTATTDEDGRWSVSGLGPAAIAVVAEQADLGRSPARRVVRGAADEQQLELVLAGFGALAGSVRDAAGPAEGKLISVQSTTTPNAMYTVLSGPDGGFRLDKLAPDSYKASAMLGMPMGRGGMQLQSKIVTVTSGGETKVDLAIDKGPITVTVIAAPSGGADVSADQVRGASWVVAGTITAHTVEQLSMATAGEAGRSGINFMRGGHTTFDDLQPGVYTACAAALPKEVPAGPMAGQEYFSRHADSLPVVCKPLTLAATPTEVTVEIPIDLPPFDPT